MLFSSHVDDIALQNFNVSSACLSCTASRTGCPCFVLSEAGAAFLLYLIGFLICWGLLFKVNWVFFMYCCCLGSVPFDCCLLE